MRISDWSSDVCSSDLQRRNAVQRVEQEMGVELIAQHRKLRRRRLRLEPEQAVGLFLELEEIVDREIERRPGGERGRIDIDERKQQAGEARFAEIGRASCRERVCQYV